MVLNKQVSHKLADQNSKMAAGLPGQEENLSPLLSTLFVLFVRDSCKNIVFIFNSDLLFEQTAYITYDSREDQVTVSLLCLPIPRPRCIAVGSPFCTCLVCSCICMTTVWHD